MARGSRNGRCAGALSSCGRPYLALALVVASCHDRGVRMLTAPDFFDRAGKLRRHFEELVGPSRNTEDSRFVWDYWHIPGQFTYFRTPALGAVPPTLLAHFTEALRIWGKEHLGATRVTVPWLSYYIEGCRQELHTDVEQGTWSYVYSLTPWEKRQFTGGETLLAGEHLLDYWGRFDPEHSREAPHLIERIPARFDQLCVFDSHLPHGVEIVEGTRDPLQARVALHGWFRPAEPVVDGPLSLEEAEPVLTSIGKRWREENSRLGPFFGEGVWRLLVEEDGQVVDVKLVVDNLMPSRGGTDSSLLRTATETLSPGHVFSSEHGTFDDPRPATDILRSAPVLRQ